MSLGGDDEVTDNEEEYPGQQILWNLWKCRLRLQHCTVSGFQLSEFDYKWI